VKTVETKHNTSHGSAEIGQKVIFVDSNRVTRNALLTMVWGDPADRPTVNLVTVSPDENKIDNYGRQIEHFTSVPHQERTTAPGMYWSF